MIKSKDLIEEIIDNKLGFITGVPDSIFKDFLFNLNDYENDITHVLATSEGEAIGIATGHYLATGEVPIVYMQNDGLCNAMNPLTSLCDKLVYSIPMILFIGWRGKDGDAVQHQRMGKILLALLELLKIPIIIIENVNDIELIKTVKTIALNENTPVATIFKRGIFEKNINKTKEIVQDASDREIMMDVILDKIKGFSVVATTGKTSRELYELRRSSVKRKQEHSNDFLMVGSMGCAASIGLGIALKNKPVCVFDGDGAVLMKMGSLATIGHYKPLQFIHIIFDNGGYSSTGGQQRVSIKWKMLFMAAGYFDVYEISTVEKLKEIDFFSLTMPAVIIIRVSPYARKDLVRPSETLAEIKNNFMNNL